MPAKILVILQIQKLLGAMLWMLLEVSISAHRGQFVTQPRTSATGLERVFNYSLWAPLWILRAVWLQSQSIPGQAGPFGSAWALFLIWVFSISGDVGTAHIQGVACGHEVSLHALAFLSHGCSNIFLKTKAADPDRMSLGSPSLSPHTGSLRNCHLSLGLQVVSPGSLSLWSWQHSRGKT